MSPLFQAVSAAGISVEGLLLWRLFARRIAKRYPYFTAYVLFDFLRALSDVSLLHFGAHLYDRVFWASDVLENCLAFLLVWEVIRSLFPAKSTVFRLAWKSLLTVCALAIPVGVLLCWCQAVLIHFPHEFVPPIFEQYVNFSQGVLLLSVAAVAAYYGVSLGRNIRGLIFGSTLFLFLDSTIYAAVQWIRGFLPYWQLIPALMYISLTAVWLWSFWEYAPAPQVATAQLDPSELEAKWDHLWPITTGTLGRGQN